MEDDQQFCLRWNNHQTTLIQNFDTLLESGTLVDCTLAAEGKYLKAHKVVLSACSPYFEGLLSEHYDKHPVFILKDVKFKELKAMMDYMYRGEVNISQDQLAALLKAAESLQIKGLSESKTAGGSGSTSNSTKASEVRQPKIVNTQSAPSLDIPHASSGLTIEKNSKVPRKNLAQTSVADLQEESSSPQVVKGISSREGSRSPPTIRTRKRYRRRSIDDNNIENHEAASNSSDIPQQIISIAPTTDDKSRDATESLGSSALMQQLTKPSDEMLSISVEKPEPNDSLIEPKSEYLEDPEESVEDLTLDDDMNDLNEMEQDNNRAGPSHDPSQHPGIAAWHVTGDRSNASGVGAVAGAPGAIDEVFSAAQEAAQAHRDSQDKKKKILLTIKEEKCSCADCRDWNLNNQDHKCDVEKIPPVKKRRGPGRPRKYVYPSTLANNVPYYRKRIPMKDSKSTAKVELLEDKQKFGGESSKEELLHDKRIGRHTCKMCGKVYRWMQSLIRHEKTTCPKIRHSCRYCSKDFKWIPSLLRHENVCLHKKHICPICNFVVANEDDLKSHMIERH